MFSYAVTSVRLALVVVFLVSEAGIVQATGQSVRDLPQRQPQ